MQINFRTARPTDAEEACPLICSAAPEAFDYVFAQNGHKSLDFL